MKKTIFSFITVTLIGGYVSAQDLPANPAPGKCYVKCITKDEFREETETIQIAPAYTKLEVVPAKYKTIEERVLVKEASKKLIYVPAVYETVNVPYEKKEAGNVLSVVPAAFGNDVKTLEVFPKTSGWEYKHLDNCPSINKDACVTACFVERPARFESINIVTLTKDAYTNETKTPAVEANFKRQVVKTPARVEEVEIPAEYATIKREVIDTPATTRKVEVPAQTKTITKQVLTKKGGVTVWEEVDCKLLEANLLPVFYEYNSAKLTKASEKIIDDVLLPLLKGKNTSVEIMSHTDSRGNDEYNMSLSQQRANAVVNYLATKGIQRSRMVAKGYGETRLINRCANGVQCSEEEHYKNRRTEFRILGQ
ncbi:MAG: OmpA family protein [Bacteroidota bacterium]|nr:OmpA family protein [Bacteroidota bacterium]